MVPARRAVMALVAISIYQTTTGQLCSELELFNCPNKTCISEHLVCDGKRDCNDGSDELRDLCLVTNMRNSEELCSGVRHFSCAGNPCLPIYKVCDGTHDCLYGTDERASVCGIKHTGRFTTRSNAQLSSGSGQCSMDQNKPMISLGIRNITYPSGSTIILHCTASTRTPQSTHFVWTRLTNGIKVHLNGTELLGLCEVSSTMQLTGVGYSGEYSGEYSCTAINEYGNDTSKAFVYIRDCMGPEVIEHPTNLSVPYGADATFRCSVCSAQYSVSTVWWFSSSLQPWPAMSAISTFNRVGSIVVSTLQLTRVGVSYRGKYWCVAQYTNTSVNSTEATLAVTVPPLVIQTLPNQTATERRDTAFVCNASGGAGSLSYHWQKLEPGDRGNVNLTSANASVMTLRALRLSDAGEYRCTVSDASGQRATSNLATLKVLAGGTVAASSAAAAIGATVVVALCCTIIAAIAVIALHYRTVRRQRDDRLEQRQCQ